MGGKLSTLQKKISKTQNVVSDNGMCSWTEVECLGGCVNAPIMQINKDYYEDLDSDSAEKIFSSFLDDKPPLPGSSRGRKSSAPEKNKANGARDA